MTESDLEAALAFQIEAIRLPVPVREYRFEPPRRYRFDFAWPDFRVAVECEGATYTSGRHTRGKGFEADCEKLNDAAVQGWLVLRVTKRMIDEGKALEYVERALALHGLDVLRRKLLGGRDG